MKEKNTKLVVKSCPTALRAALDSCHYPLINYHSRELKSFLRGFSELPFSDNCVPQVFEALLASKYDVLVENLKSIMISSSDGFTNCYSTNLLFKHFFFKVFLEVEFSILINTVFPHIVSSLE